MNLATLFHKKYGLPAFSVPTIPSDPSTVRTRIAMVREEFEEVLQELTILSAQTSGNYRTEDRLATMGKLLKELADLRYVVDGTATALGLDIEEAYKAVHESNMTKDGANFNGKIQKGKGYVPPDMEQFVLVIEGKEVIDEEHRPTGTALVTTR